MTTATKALRLEWNPVAGVRLRLVDAEQYTWLRIDQDGTAHLAPYLTAAELREIVERLAPLVAFD